jgi:hypothetical protein
LQREQVSRSERLSLPKPSIDTGMGLERIAAVLQGTHDNYATDLMRALIMAVADATGVDPDGPQKASHRVIADHLRASSFLVADGVLPSNEGRGYVLRRIMRRRSADRLLGARAAAVAPRPGAGARWGRRTLNCGPIAPRRDARRRSGARKTLERGLRSRRDPFARQRHRRQAKRPSPHDTFGFPST